MRISRSRVLAGDIFQLGNKSYRIQRVERGIVRVEDAHGMAPTIPFWLGEAPGRSDELSASVSRLRAHMAALLRRDPSGQAALRWRIDGCAMDPAAAEQLVEYLAAGDAALGSLPTQDNIVLERFFDEAGGMQLIRAFALRQPHQSSLGASAAEAVLPQVQFRASGSRH